MKLQLSTILPLLVSLVAGGLAGAVLTWYLNRPNPTLITYSVTTTSLGTNPEVRNIIPGVKLQIGDEEVPAIHTHSVEIGAVDGAYLNTAEIAVTFPVAVRFLGKILAETPSPIHHMECTSLPNGARCKMGPFAIGTGRFRVMMATDNKEPPTAAMAMEKAKLIRAEDFTGAADRPWTGANVIPFLSVLLATVATLVALYVQWINRRDLAEVEKQRSELLKMLGEAPSTDKSDARS